MPLFCSFFGIDTPSDPSRVKVNHRKCLYFVPFFARSFFVVPFFFVSFILAGSFFPFPLLSFLSGLFGSIGFFSPLLPFVPFDPDRLEGKATLQWQVVQIAKNMFIIEVFILREKREHERER